LSNKFVTDAREVVKTGDIVKVKVLEVDLSRKRISLTMKLDAKPVAKGESGGNQFRHAERGQRAPAPGARQAGGASASQAPSAMAAAFAKLQTKN